MSAVHHAVLAFLRANDPGLAYRFERDRAVELAAERGPVSQRMHALKNADPMSYAVQLAAGAGEAMRREREAAEQKAAAEQAKAGPVAATTSRDTDPAAIVARLRTAEVSK